MSFWNEVKTKLKNSINVIQNNPILDAFATSALESIPVVGNLLVKMYENSRDCPEDKTKQILILLQKMNSMDENKLEIFCRNLEKNKNLILENQIYLKEISTDTSIIINKLDEAKKERKIIVNDVQKIQNTLDKLYEKIEQLEFHENSQTQETDKQPNTFFDSDFKISWPNGWERVSREEIVQSAQRFEDSFTQNLDLEEISHEAFVLRKRSNLQNNPNINIVKDQPVVDIEEFLNDQKEFYETQLGWKVIKATFDRTIGMGTLEAKLNPFGMTSFTIQKFYFRKTYTLLITITQLTQDQLDDDPSYAREITEILQSLVFLT